MSYECPICGNIDLESIDDEVYICHKCRTDYHLADGKLNIIMRYNTVHKIIAIALVVFGITILLAKMLPEYFQSQENSKIALTVLFGSSYIYVLLATMSGIKTGALEYWAGRYVFKRRNPIVYYSTLLFNLLALLYSPRFLLLIYETNGFSP